MLEAKYTFLLGATVPGSDPANYPQDLRCCGGEQLEGKSTAAAVLLEVESQNSKLSNLWNGVSQEGDIDLGGVCMDAGQCLAMED